MAMKASVAALALLVWGLTATAATATPLTGGFAIGGTFRWTDLTGAGGVPLATAMSIDFNQDGTATNSGTFFFFGGSGDFAGLGLKGESSASPRHSARIGGDVRRSPPGPNGAWRPRERRPSGG
jgi:hypothetical protein